MNSTNKILITGGSKGIGNEIVKFFLRKNYKVLCLSRTKPKIINSNLNHIKIDLAKRSQLLKKKTEIISFKPNILFNNVADIGEIGKFTKVNIRKWEESFFLNFFVSIYLTKFLIPNISKKKGHIFFMAGGGAANSFPGFSSYSVAKTATVRFVENLAEENNGKFGTYILSPGPVKTKLYNDAKKAGHRVPKNRFVSPNKVLDLIEYILESNSKYLSGRYIHVKDQYFKKNNKTIKNLFLLRRTEMKR